MNGTQERKWVEFLKRMTLSVLYFLLFAIFCALTALTYNLACEKSHFYHVFQFIGMLTGSIIFLICFISSWEDIFEEEDED